MKGKIFIIAIMLGIPSMAWAFVAWVVMISLGALHSLCSAIPNLSFLESFFVTLTAFTAVIFAFLWRRQTRDRRAAGAAAEPIQPSEETARRQKS